MPGYFIPSVRHTMVERGGRPDHVLMTSLLPRVSESAEELGDVEILGVEVRVDGEEASAQLFYLDGKSWRQSLSSEQQLRVRIVFANRKVVRREHPGARTIERTSEPSEEGSRWRHVAPRSPSNELTHIFEVVTAELTGRQPDRVIGLTVHLGAKEVVADLQYLGGLPQVDLDSGVDEGVTVPESTSGAATLRYRGTEMLILLLWDVDHTLIDNGGVSKANLCWGILPARRSARRACTTDGRENRHRDHARHAGRTWPSGLPPLPCAAGRGSDAGRCRQGRCVA